VREVHTYETVLDEEKNDEILELLEDESIDYITFASSSTATNFVDIIGKNNIDKLKNTKIISIGPITSQTSEELKLNIYKEAKEATIDSMILSMIN
ncbi:MAG: uroporphyrinogen-III synthase, partial [Clostridium sp.]